MLTALSDVFEGRERWHVALCDCRFALSCMPADSVDAVVTDPPYGIGFMGKKWDSFSPQETERRREQKRRKASDNPGGRGELTACIEYDRTAAGNRRFQEWCEEWAREAYRVLKPGAHLVAFGGTRTFHRIACAIEDAGFQIRDSLAWLYASGFPKSLNVGDGYGTALKPAFEPVIVARKPPDGTIAASVQRYGTGALNIDGCRIACSPEDFAELAAGVEAIRERGGKTNSWKMSSDLSGANPASPLGRWPANILFDEATAAELDAQSGERVSSPYPANVASGAVLPFTTRTAGGYSDTGGASRFFFTAKASRSERDAGLDYFAPMSGGAATDRKDGSAGLDNPRAGAGRNGGARNVHPTVKPIDLMRWLVRLVTRPGSLVLDPFCGSGTTGIATMLESEGRRFIGLELEPIHVDYARARIAHVVGGYVERECRDAPRAVPVQMSIFEAMEARR